MTALQLSAFRSCKKQAKALKIERDVDFKAETITLHEFVRLDGQKYEFTEEGKNDWAPRTIPLFQPLKETLEGKTGYLITSAEGEKVDTIQAFKSAWESYLFCMETAINGMQKHWYTDAQIGLALELLESGKSYGQVQKMTGISKSTLVRARKNNPLFRHCKKDCYIHVRGNNNHSPS